MKMRFPWFLPLVAGMLLFGLLMPVHAASVGLPLGPLTLTIPWDNVNAVYLYNVTEKINEVGGEAVFAKIKIGTLNNNPMDIDLTAGGVLNPTGSTVGTGFAGFNFMLPVSNSPLLTWVAPIQPGLFGGYDIHNHLWIFGLKAAIPIFQG